MWQYGIACVLGAYYIYYEYSQGCSGTPTCRVPICSSLIGSRQYEYLANPEYCYQDEDVYYWYGYKNGFSRDWFGQNDFGRTGIGCPSILEYYTTFYCIRDVWVTLNRVMTWLAKWL